MLRSTIILLFAALLVHSCSSDDSNPSTLNPTTNQPTTNEWLVPVGEVFDGGPGLDGIPSIDNPKFSKASDVDFLFSNDLILGIQVDGEIRGYPHPILDWHEIVNDRLGNEMIALTYCPLTGTGIGWDREVNDRVTTEFGVSGLLYNSNLMPFDRTTGSTWSQQRLDCVNGNLIGTRIETHTFIETTWETWLEAFPDSDVLNTDTGFNRDYRRYPYGDYRTNNSTIFPINNQDDRLHPKQRVLGVNVGGDYRAYQFSDLDGNQLFEETVGTDDVLVVSNRQRNFIVAFRPDPAQVYTLLGDDQFPDIIQDATGARFNILGGSSNQIRQTLDLHEQFFGFWFSWGTFYEGLELVQL